MMIDRDPGDETDHEPGPKLTPDPRACWDVLSLIGSTGTLSQRALERLELAQRQHHQERLRQAA